MAIWNTLGPSGPRNQHGVIPTDVIPLKIQLWKRVLDDIGLLALITMFNLTNLEKCSIDISEKTRKQMESISVSTGRFTDQRSSWFKLHGFPSEFSYFFQRYLIEILYKKRIINKESNTGINGLSFLLNAATISE